MKKNKLLKTLSVGALIGIGVFSLASCNNDTEESSDDYTYTITATIGPDYASDLTVDWTEAWIDKSVDDTITDYCTIAESDDTLTCTVTCVAAFSNQITITATSNSDTSLTAITTVDYLPKYWGTYTNDVDEVEFDLSTMTISNFISEYLRMYLFKFNQVLVKGLSYVTKYIFIGLFYLIKFIFKGIVFLIKYLEIGVYKIIKFILKIVGKILYVFLGLFTKTKDKISA